MTDDELVETVNRRALLGVGASAIAAMAGFVAGRASAPEPDRKNWREKHYSFWLDVNEWVEPLDDVDYSPEAWQCCARFLAPDSVGKALYLRRPGEDEWKYRLESQSAVSSVYQRLPEERNQELTEQYGDARREDLP